MDKNSIKNLLTNTFVSEAKVPGLDVTNKAKSESGKQNKKAIQDIGQEFASMPVIYSKTNQKIGDVRTGSGQLGFYGGTGANPNISKLGVKEMARVLIQTRINYSNKAPVFVPIYFNL